MAVLFATRQSVVTRLAETSFPARSVTALTLATTDCEPRSTPSMPVTLSARTQPRLWPPRCLERFQVRALPCLCWA